MVGGLIVANISLAAIRWPHFGSLNHALGLVSALGAFAVTLAAEPERLGLPARPRKRVVVGASIFLIAGAAWIAAGAPR